jgi:serine/threonine-protein kinase
MTGSTVSHFKVIREIGRGGMGVVYEAEDLNLGRRVALKFLNPDRLATPHDRKRFLREAQSAAALNHPNICTIYEIHEQDGQLFLAMEYCEGVPLRQLIRKGPLDWSVAISIVLQVAEGLAEAHRRQIIHRDVKSANIMIDTRHRARLLDFGLARPAGVSEATLTLEHCGTPAYMAPERFEEGSADARSDIWALGVVLYEAVTGRLPFVGDRVRVAHAILTENPVLPSSLIAGLPSDLDDVVERALAKEPSERYQTVEDLAADLILVLRHPHLDPTVTATSSAPGQPSSGSTDKERVGSVAVLPFANLSHCRDDDFLSDGLTEEITNALTQVQGLQVASRLSTFQFRSVAIDARDVGRKLQVRALVLGSLRREGDRLRVVAQLVRASSGYQIWSQRFECQMRSVFDVEDQLTEAIIGQLRKWLGVNLQFARTSGGTSDVDAHELYLRGRHSFNLQTAQGAADGLRYFSQALQLSPRYALAKIGMADCYALQAWYGMAPPTEVMPKAKAELRDAIGIEEMLPSAWCLLAAITAGFDWDWEAARAQFQKAFSVGSSTSDLHFHHALDLLTPLGRLQEALEEVKIALELDPAAPLLNTAVGGCLYRLRRYPAALRQLQSTLELAPDFYHAYWTMARVYEAQRQFDRALEYFNRALATSPANPALLADEGHCRAEIGDTHGARQILEQLQRSPLGLAIVHLGLGENDAVLDYLRAAVRERARGLIWLGVDPRFDHLCENPAYREVIAPVGL